MPITVTRRDARGTLSSPRAPRASFFASSDVKDGVFGRLSPSASSEPIVVTWCNAPPRARFAISATATAFGTARPVAVTVTTREVDAPVSDCVTVRSRVKKRGVVEGTAGGVRWASAGGARFGANVGRTEAGIWKAHLQSVGDVRHVVPYLPSGLHADLVPVRGDGGREARRGLGHRLERTRARVEVRGEGFRTRRRYVLFGALNSMNRRQLCRNQPNVGGYCTVLVRVSTSRVSRASLLK